MSDRKSQEGLEYVLPISLQRLERKTGRLGLDKKSESLDFGSLGTRSQLDTRVEILKALDIQVYI